MIILIPLLANVLGGLSIPVACCIAFVTVVILIAITCSAKSKTSPFKIDTYLLLPKNFEVDKENILDLKIHNIEGLNNMVANVNNFCKSHNASVNTTESIDFIVTEITKHTKNFGIKDLLLIKDVYLRIVCIKGSWVIRLRDDCREFDPKQYVTQSHHETKEFEEKLDLVKQTVSSYDYKHLMGFNISTITIKEPSYGNL
ncbi:MAG: hypothetical protein MJ054_01195 [Clostridia bacterium]|nr:hypothetical protein [Clostridia bacterium]